MILEEGRACAPAEIKAGIEVTGHQAKLPDFRSELSTGLHQCQEGGRGRPAWNGRPQEPSTPSDLRPGPCSLKEFM